MKTQKNVHWVVTILLIIATLPLACYGAILAEQAYIWWADLENIYYLGSTWHLLPLPPDKTKGFAGINPGTVYIQTEDGKEYGCFQPTEVDSNCWFEIDGIPPLPKDISRILMDCPADRLLPIPESPPYLYEIESIQIRYCSISFREWTVSDFKYVFTEEGEIWQYGDDGLDLVKTPEYNKRQWNRTRLKIMLFAFSVGGLLPITVIILIWLKRSKDYKRDKTEPEIP